VAFALWHKRGPTKQVLAGRLAATVAAALPGRQVHLVADAWYAGTGGSPGATRGPTRDRSLPAGVSLTSRLRVTAALYAINTPQPGAMGRPRLKGPKLGTAKDIAATIEWTCATVSRYGRTDTVHVAERTCLWYDVYRSRPLRLVLVRDLDRDTALALITTDLTSSITDIVSRYASRWSVEVTIADAKQITASARPATAPPKPSSAPSPSD
jgi:hypothetical protein